MKLDQNQTQALLKEYKGPRYKIEKHVMVLNLIFLCTFVLDRTCIDRSKIECNDEYEYRMQETLKKCLNGI